MSVEFIRTCWSVLRVLCRSSAEGIFICSLINTIYKIRNCKNFETKSRRETFIFTLVYSLMTAILVVPLKILTLHRIANTFLTAAYFWYKRQKTRKNLLNEHIDTQEIKYALTVAVVLTLAFTSSHNISHMIAHTYCTSTGIYDAVCSNWIWRDLYKSSMMVLDILLIYLVYKSQFIKIRDIKAISIHRWVLFSFSLCLISHMYMVKNYDSFSNIPALAPYRYVLLWTSGLLLPIYWSFYLIVTRLSNLLNLKANAAVDDSIFAWIFDPSMVETTHLEIYDSNSFVAEFESKKFNLKRKLKKLGIDNRYRGYSELVFCIILTRLFMGLTNWNFERDIFGQASLVTDVPLAKLRKNINHIIKQTWFTNESQDLIDGYYLPFHNSYTYDQENQPRTEDFLISIAKSI